MGMLAKVFNNMLEFLKGFAEQTMNIAEGNLKSEIIEKELKVIPEVGDKVEFENSASGITGYSLKTGDEKTGYNLKIKVDRRVF